MARVRRGSNGRSAELVGVAQPVVRCGEGGGVGRGCEIADRRVRTPLVVAGDPPGNDGSGVVEIVEDRLVEQFIAHAAVEGFADAVLHRLAGRDEKCNATLAAWVHASIAFEVNSVP